MVAYKVRKGDGTWYTLGSGTGATAKIRQLDGTWASDDGTGLLAKVRKADGTMATGVDFAAGAALDPGQLYPEAWTEVQVSTSVLHVQAFGAPAIDAISDEDDATYVQLRQSSTQQAWAKWRLPAIDTTGITAAAVSARLYYDPTILDGLTSSPPQGSAILTYDADGIRDLDLPYPTLAASTYTDWSQAFDVTSTTSRQTNFANWLAQLEAGNGWVWTTMGFQFNKSSRLNVVELYVSLT